MLKAVGTYVSGGNIPKVSETATLHKKTFLFFVSPSSTPLPSPPHAPPPFLLKSLCILD